MKEIYINADDYNSDSIKTIQGNNNAEEYKIYLQYDNEKIDLTGKTVNLGFLRVGSTEGDIIENLNVTNPKEGEITLKITNKISKRNGTYSCQLAILGEGDFLEHTATFTLTVENNIFSDITKAIADSKDFTYLERILEEAKTVSGDLKTNIPVAFNLNTSLESNINNANTVNQTLMATTEQSKVAATEATQKKSELESSLEETKKFIEGLDGSQNIPQIRMDVTELQNGLKSNQSLSYEGSSIAANNTLEGRTEGMRIVGRALVNLAAKKDFFISEDNSKATYSWSNMKNLYKAGIYTIKNITGKILVWNIHKIDNDNWVKAITVNSSSTITLEENQYIRNIQALSLNGFIIDDSIEKILSENVIILDNNQVDVIDSIKYFEGLKSFGETEKVGDKYKISILSNNENYFKLTNDNIFGIGTTVTVNGNSFTTTTTNGWNQGFGIQVDRIPSGKYKTVFEVIENKDKGVLYEIEYFKDNNSIKTMPLNYVQYEGIINVENIDYDYFKLKFKNGRE